LPGTDFLYSPIFFIPGAIFGAFTGYLVSGKI